MKTCPSCSNECKDSATICPRCGKKLMQPNKIRRIEPPPLPPMDPPKSKLSRKEHVALGLVIGGVAGALIALVTVLLVNRPGGGPIVPAPVTGTNADVVTSFGAAPVVEETMAPPVGEAAPVAVETAAPALDQMPVEAPAEDVAPVQDEVGSPVGDGTPEEVTLPGLEAEPPAEAEPVEETEPPAEAEPVEETGPVIGANGASDTLDWDLSMAAPQHLWLKVQTTIAEAVPPVISLYHMNGEDSVYAIINQITPVRAESPQAEVTWLWDVAPKWNDLKGAFGTQTTPLNMVAVYGEGNVVEQPYEVLWDCMNYDELALREQLGAEGYVFGDAGA